MVYDASIFQNLGRGVTPIQSPMELYGQAQQLRQLAGQGQLQDMQIQQHQQAMADQDRKRNIFEVAGGDPEALQKGLLGGGYIKEANELAKAKADREKERVDFQTAHMGLKDKELSYTSKTTEMITNVAASALASSDERVKDTLMSGMTAIAPHLMPSENDTPLVSQDKQQKLKMFQSFSEKLPNMTPEEIKATSQQVFNQGKTHSEWLKQLTPEGEAKGFHPAIDTKSGKAVLVNDRGEVREGLRPLPPASVTINAQNKAERASLGLEGNPLYAQAESIAHLQQGMPSRQGKDTAELNVLVAKIREKEGKPKYNANEWTKVKRSNEHFTGQGKAAQILTSNDTLFGHADEAIETLNAAGLNDARALNFINQFLSKQTGQDAKYKELKVASKVYGAELASMLGEHDAAQKIETQKLFDNIDSPASFLAAVRQSQKMAATRSASLANQYFRETGLDPVENGILPERVARAAVDSAAAKGYTWADKYKKGAAEGKEKQVSQAASMPDPDMSTLGKNPRFPNAVWVKKGPSSEAGWYAKRSGNVERVE